MVHLIKTGTKCDRNSAGNPPAGSPLQILEKESYRRTNQSGGSAAEGREGGLRKGGLRYGGHGKGRELGKE